VKRGPLPQDGLQHALERLVEDGGRLRLRQAGRGRDRPRPRLQPVRLAHRGLEDVADRRVGEDTRSAPGVAAREELEAQGERGARLASWSRTSSGSSSGTRLATSAEFAA